MKIYKTLSYTLFIIILVSCKSTETKDFLDFKIGMPKNDFFNALDSLVESGSLYQSGNDYFYDFEISKSITINSRLSYEFKNDELTEIGLWLGHRRLNPITNTYSINECLEAKEIQYVYDLYKSKYGNPDGYHSEGYPYWKKSKNKEVRFSTGYKNQYTCDTTRYLMGGFIIYQYNSDYELNKDIEEMRKKEKKKKDNI